MRGAVRKWEPSLTPGTIVNGTLAKGSLIFPITGGNATVFEPGEVSPYVIGQIHHVGSGFSLSAGGTKVSLTSFNVDPGVSKVFGDVRVNGKMVATGAYLFKLDGRTLEPLTSKGNIATLAGHQGRDLARCSTRTSAPRPQARPLVGIAKIVVKVKWPPPEVIWGRMSG